MLFKKIIYYLRNYIFDSSYRFGINAYLGLYNQLSDEDYLKKMFYRVMHKRLDLNNPETFNEKLQWLKLFDRDSRYTKMVDKYEVKQYISEKIGSEYIIPTLGVWDKFDDIDFDLLPDKFVLKCTHDSGGLVICSDKNRFDKKKARKKINRSLRTNYYSQKREWPYKNVIPRIIAEQYMVDESGKELKDYKLLCFSGKVEYSFVCSERFKKEGLKVTFFDKEWKKMPFTRSYPASKKLITKPVNYKKMVELAETLSHDILFVRVDFYEIRGKIYFGELTFYPGSGLEAFQPEEWDYKLGSLINLPNNNGKRKGCYENINRC